MEQKLIIGLLCASVAMLLAPLVIWLAGKMGKHSNQQRKAFGLSAMLRIFLWLLGAVWCLRYAVGYFIIVSQQADAKLTVWEEIIDSLLRAMQTFSMGGDYTYYVAEGRNMMAYVFGGDSWLVPLYSWYHALLTIVAPIAGGAILFEILASIFPAIRLQLAYWCFWREKYYFSKINPAALALANSLQAGGGKHPVLIFTDAYGEDNGKKSPELLAEAKRLGAICIREDLGHIRKNCLGRRTFLLMDEQESRNLQTMAELTDPGNAPYLKEAEVCLFTNADTYVQLEQRLRQKLMHQYGFSQEELPVLIPVKPDRNLISNLLADVPLYEPLVGKGKKADGIRDLTVTILGSGAVGTEMFLSTYWFGQILDCNLKIRVVSLEPEDSFWSRMDGVNPEIRRSTIPGDPILRINRKGDMADVYCQVEYLQRDVHSSEFAGWLDDGQVPILESDYFLVAVGSDQENISVADGLRRAIGRHSLAAATPGRKVIAYVVYDADLSDTLNQQQFFGQAGQGAQVYLRAIGSLREVYSVRNVFMTEYDPFAQVAYEAYLTHQNRQKTAAAHEKRSKDDYKFWANMARSMHKKYKFFSLGLIDFSVFDTTPEGYAQGLKQARAAYNDLVSGKTRFTDSRQEAAHIALLHRMSWLEHRRWNAFTRVKGFRYTDLYDAYAASTGSYKEMDLKLHPCLVECDQAGIRAKMDVTGRITDQFSWEDRSDFDLLDDLSYDLYDKKLNDYDFKLYDYPLLCREE
jgi:hypothetical protein